MNILFVCTGNTCRSPMAEALLKERYPKAQVKSAGVFASEGSEASSNAIKALAKKDITIDHHSQPVTENLLHWADLVLTMTTNHKRHLIMENPNFQEKYFTLKEYVSDSSGEATWQEFTTANENDDISDPFGGDLSMYQETLKELNQNVDRLLKKMENR